MNHDPISCHGTSIAVGIKQGGGVGEASAVGVVVDGAHPWLVPATVPAGLVDRITDAAVCQPARVAAVQPGLPSQIELPDSSQLASESVAVRGGCGQTQLLGCGGVEHLACK